MSNNYTLGRGKVHFAQFKAGTQTPGAERYLGNTPELSFSGQPQDLDHYNSDEGINLKDESILLQMDYSGALTTDNIHVKNLAMFFLGEAATLSVAADTGIAFTLTDIEQGGTYQLGMTASNPSGDRAVANVAITSPAAVEDTDYTVDLALGRITIIEGSAVLTEGLASASGTYDTTAVDRKQVITRGEAIEGAMRFIAINPAGENIDYYMPWVKLSPNGDFQLKGDTWQSIPFTLQILQKTGYESIYADGRAYTPA